MITAYHARDRLWYEPTSGRLYWKPINLHQCKSELYQRRWNSRLAGRRAGTNSNHYRYVNLLGEHCLEHRVVWLINHRTWPPEHIDHIDGDGFNNRLSNLRAVTRSENARNSKLRRSNKTGAADVSWSKQKKKWHARIWTNGKRKNLGFYSSLDGAKRARAAAETKYDYHPNHGRKH